jgi:hypothetical protein
MVCEWEKDKKKPSRESMEKLAKFFRMSRNTSEDMKMRRKRAL